ncbi:hypothetical protein BV898_01792 [Hypsibius exemplaris]|uniref:V-type proton ATPase subunit S1/VOA1 transmembrane domain-containing protein n=1 Tax=Hypsibius exemplaris TaxID=2072580 RepID=A0A1W0XAB0_HYPEX|nr:hypothetical protein BV898_01792 [Hypsibius exemplaris]
MTWKAILPSKALCALLLCFGFCFSSTFAVKVKSVAEAREDLLDRQERATQKGNSTEGVGIFGNTSIIWSVENCLLMETTAVGLQVQQLDKKDKSLHAVLQFNNSDSTVDGECTGTVENGTQTANIVVKFTGTGSENNVTDASFQMVFTGDRFNWILTNLTLSATFYDLVNKTHETLTDVALNTRELFASRGASYYCTDQPGFQVHYGSQIVTLYFIDLILEPFANTSLGFSPIENCEYAFGIGIWMGIITALVMGLILGLGISMLASIRNMDRFDDPKTSKLLSVPSE